MLGKKKNLFKYGDIVQLTDAGREHIRKCGAENWFDGELRVMHINGNLGIAMKQDYPWFSINEESLKWFEPLDLFEYDDIEPQLV